MSSNPTKIAVIGAGHLGKFHSRIASKLDQFELVAVADPSESARTALSEEVGCRGVADYRGLFGQIDAAVLATPTVTHHEIGSQLLMAGVHCLIEKPLAPSEQEASDLVELAKLGKRVLQVGHVERFNPALEAAGDAVKNPKFITATRTSGYTFRSTDIGAVLDIMIHDIDLVLGMVQAPVRDVQAMGMSVMGDHEDMATALLTFGNGCVAQLTASRVSYAMQRTMQVFTETGFVGLDFTTREATTVQPREDLLGRRFSIADLSPAQRETMRAGLFDELLVKKTEEAPAVNAIELELAEFGDAIQTGATPRVSGEVGRDAVAVAEQVLKAIDQHAWDFSPEGRRGPKATPAFGTPLRKVA